MSHVIARLRLATGMVELDVPHMIVAPETATPTRAAVPAARVRRAALLVPLCGSAAIVLGLALGYVLSGRPDLSSIPSKMTGITHGSVRLRIDYELRKSTLCPEPSAHCRRIRVVYR